jgi:nicotinamidase-related amidase
MTTLEDRPNTALLVVDVQAGVVAGAHERDAVVANVGSLVERARRERVPVVWVQHSDEGLARGSDEWRIVPELSPDDAEPLVEKHYGDSFEDTSLETVLSGLGVGRLVVVGAQTDGCIRSTLHGALARGYDATLVSDAHTTEDQTAWGRRRPARSSRTRTSTGHTRRRRGARPGRSRPRASTSATRPDAGTARRSNDRGSLLGSWSLSRISVS